LIIENTTELLELLYVHKDQSAMHYRWRTQKGISANKNTADNTIETKLIKKTTEDIPTDVHACSSNNADGVSSTTA